MVNNSPWMNLTLEEMERKNFCICERISYSTSTGCCVMSKGCTGFTTSLFPIKIISVTHDPKGIFIWDLLVWRNDIVLLHVLEMDFNPAQSRNM